MAISSLRYRGKFSPLTGVFLLAAIAFFGTAVPAGAAAPGPDAAATRLSETKRAQRLVANLPLYFIENQGQLDRRAAYYVHGRDKVIYFTAGGLTVVLHGQRQQAAVSQAAAVVSASGNIAPIAAARWALQLDFVDADPAVRPSGENPSTALISYFTGRPEEWQPAVKTFTRLVYPDLWPGIDLVFTGVANQLKYLFVVKPGADPSAIKLRYRGADSVAINHAGQLEVRTPLGDLKDDRPTAYQDGISASADVEVAYSLLPRADNESYQYGFKLAAYDRSVPLIIDPAVFVYAGFIGGSGDDRGNAIAVDSDGNATVNLFSFF